MSELTPLLRVKVLFFGRLKEIAGHGEEFVEITDGATLESVFLSCAERQSLLLQFRSSLVASRNQEFAAWDTLVRSGDEIAFLPPVSGG